MGHKMCRWSIVGIVCGFLFAVFSGIRYYLIYPDVDKAIVYVVVGALICAVAWLHDQSLMKSNIIDSVELKLQDLTEVVDEPNLTKTVEEEKE